MLSVLLEWPKFTNMPQQNNNSLSNIDLELKGKSMAAQWSVTP